LEEIDHVIGEMFYSVEDVYAIGEHRSAVEDVLCCWGSYSILFKIGRAVGEDRSAVEAVLSCQGKGVLNY